MLSGIVTQSNLRIPSLFSGWIRRPGVGLGLRLALLAAAATILVRTAWLCDDAYITLRTVDHFVHGYGLRYNIAERVQAYTHPLWLWLLVPPYAVTGSNYFAPLGLGLVLSLLTVALVLFRSRRPTGPVLLAAGTLLLSKAFVDYSTSGLENPLTHLLLLLFLLLLDEGAPGSRRLLLLGTLAGLAAWNRIDTLLLFAPGLALSLARFRDRRGLLLAGAGFVPFLLWELFATFYYGFPYPNTAVAKLSSGIGGLALARQGLFYFRNSLLWDPVTLVVIALALAAAVRRRTGRELAVAAGIVLYLLYTVKIGGDFMSGRYFSAPLLAAVILLLRTDPFPVRFGRPALAVLVLGLAAITPHRSATSGSDFGLYSSDIMDAHGICDERRYYFGWSGWFNGAPAGERPIPSWTHDGRVAEKDHAPLMVEGAIGVAAFFAGPSVHMVDRYGLSEPLLARLPAVRKDVAYDVFLQGTVGVPDAQGWRIGHFLRNPPAGYLATLLEGKNRIEDPRLARFYDHLSGVVRGPLWSAHRLAEIVRMNLGFYDNLLDRTRPEYQSIDWGEALRSRPGEADFYLRRGMSAETQGNWDDAEADLQQALRLDPDIGEADAALGAACKRNGDMPKAAGYWEKAIELDPDLTGAYAQLGDYWMGEEKFERAAACFQRGLYHDPSGTALFNNIGSAYAILGRDAEAIPWLEKATRYIPGDHRAWDNLGQSLMAVGNLKRARRVFARSMSLQEDDQNLMHAGLADSDLGRPQQGIRELRRAVELNPGNLEALFYLGLILAERGEQSETIDCWLRSARGGFPPAQDSLRARHISW